MKRNQSRLLPMLVTFAMLSASHLLLAAPSQELEVDATSMVLSANGRSLVWSDAVRTCWIDVPTKHLLSSFSLGGLNHVRFLCLSSDAQTALVERNAQSLELWKRKGAMAVRKWRWDGTTNTTAALIQSHRILIHSAGMLWTLDLKGHLISQRKIASFGTDHDVFSLNGRFLWADSNLYDLRNGRSLVQLWEELFIDQVHFSSSANFVFVSAIGPLNEGNGLVFDTRSGKMYRPRLSQEWFDSAWAPNDTLSQTVQWLPLRFTNVRTGATSRFRPPTPWPHAKKRSRLISVQFSHDGRMMAALAKSGRIWIETSHERPWMAR